jgi:hypothetical protein
MCYCKLCKKNKADKKGSHIVPHFLLKFIDNEPGSTKRDHELGFVIGEFDTKSYFGRSVQPEKLEEMYGELKEEEIANNKSPLIVDNFFCTSCENRFSIIESKYAETLKVSSSNEYETGLTSEFGLLFWMSVIWRISISRKTGLRLTSGESEIVRRILDRTLSESLSSIDIKGMQEAKDTLRISYRLLRCPGYPAPNGMFLFVHPNFRNPYSLVIGEFIVLFSLKNNFTNYEHENKELYGLAEDIRSATTNKIKTKEKVRAIINDKMDSLNEGITHELANLRMKRTNSILDEFHVRAGGVGNTMPIEIKQKIHQEMADEEKKLGRKYTNEDLVKSAYKIMKECSSI